MFIQNIETLFVKVDASVKSPQTVIPAKAGIRKVLKLLDATGLKLAGADLSGPA
ncbi:MAG: hypothetical protein WBN77_17815 [Desulfobacterales bacterium]|uniref:Uncharacterized protein n=1 Tax=uncultured Desulfobacterium sp. TaxID=201089 RepID=E1YDD4_9BACT|nr:unknown protein [uncultured Desulfobacterium sp.]